MIIFSSKGVRHIKYLLFSWVFMLVMGGCVNREAQEQGKRTQSIISDPKVRVNVVRSRVENVPELLNISGFLRSVKDSKISVKRGGKIVRVHVVDGERVQANSILVEQDPIDSKFQVSQARAALSAAKSRLLQAELNLKVRPDASSARIASAQAEVQIQKESLRKLINGARQEERIQATAAEKSAKISQKVAKKDFKRIKQLYEVGAVSKQELDRSEQIYESAKSDYERVFQNQKIIKSGAREEDVAIAKQRVKAAEQAYREALVSKKLDPMLKDQLDQARADFHAAKANLGLVQENLNECMIRAPFSGYVSGPPLQQGTFAAPGVEVVRLVDLKSLYFESQIPEVFIGKLRPGMKAEITISALKDRSFSGKVSFINPVEDEVARIFNARVNLDELDPKLKVGMFAQAKITLSSVKNAVVVPVSAIVRSNGKEYVFVVQGKQVKKVLVKTGLRVDSLVEVRGLEAGKQVVVAGQDKLFNHSLIEVEKVLDF